MKCPAPERTHLPRDEMIRRVGGVKEFIRILQRATLWHLPPHRWETEVLGTSNGTMSDDGLHGGGSTKVHIYAPNTPLFCVVRHPYDRLISEYYFAYVFYVNRRTTGKSMNIITSDHLNSWAQRQMRDRRIFSSISDRNPWSWYPEHLYGRGGGHWIPQYDFVYNDQGRQIIDHVLRFENLTAEFDVLMHQYNMTNITLPRIQTSDFATGNHKGLKGKSSTKLRRKDLSEKTKAMIHVIFSQDFDTFGYQRDVISEEWTESTLWAQS